MSETRKVIVELKDLSTHYGEVVALDNINLQVYEREILVIMGHSGSGKSTLFRNVLGLMRPSSGSIRILDQDVTRLDIRGLYELRKHIGVAFQHGALFSSLSVRENVELPLQDLMPAQLSGGMLKRAGLARAVIMDPKLLFFDEPSAGLDPVTSAELDKLILQLRDAMNMTIIIITHDLESAFHVADRITILDKGQQIITGTRDEIRACQDSRVTNMLNRLPGDKLIDADAYLHQLTR
jgi:phospholipid/cholesterol/gamma-HCH transport system ATP-binding protein